MQGKLDCASFHWPIKILRNQMWEVCKEYNTLLSNALVILAWASDWQNYAAVLLPRILQE